MGGVRRCVVMVGLPYPDRSDPELQQKLQYIDSLANTPPQPSASGPPPPLLGAHIKEGHAVFGSTEKVGVEYRYMLRGRCEAFGIALS